MIDINKEKYEQKMSDIREKIDSALDAYRDAAYWAGYRDAKDEILELHAKNKGP